MEICSYTVRELSGIESIPIPLIQNAAAELAEQSDRHIRFSDRRLSSELCSQTTLAIAEQLFRFRACPELFGRIVCGKYGEMLAMVMIASLSKQKRRNKSESTFQHTRTRFGTVRNFWSESETIVETASCILHNAVDSIGLILPISMGDTIEVNSGFNMPRRWTEFVCYNNMDGSEQSFASYMDSEELALLERVIDHNQQVGPNEWQFIMATTKRAEKVCDLFDNPDIITVRRIKRSLQAAISNCVVAAFAASAFRFIVLEFGHSRELQNGLELDRKTKFSHRVADMIPIDYRERLSDGATPLQKRILEINNYQFVESAADIYDELLLVMNNPPGKAWFYRQFSELMSRAKEIIRDEMID